MVTKTSDGLYEPMQFAVSTENMLNIDGSRAVQTRTKR